MNTKPKIAFAIKSKNILIIYFNQNVLMYHSKREPATIIAIAAGYENTSKIKLTIINVYIR
jgi:hypothetical protein